MKARPVLPDRFWRDPADVCDELRRLDAFAEVVRLREIRKKQRKIRALVRRAKNGKR